MHHVRHSTSSIGNAAANVIEKSYYKLRRWGEAAWHQAKTGFFAVYDDVRDFFVTLDEETRPNRAKPKARPKPPPSRKAEVPPGFQVYAIGDVHGRVDLLRRLIDVIEADAEQNPEARTVLVFLGDYVDRGFQSRDVIDFLLSDRLGNVETHFLKGNHESAFETFLSDPDFGPQWARFGGAETLMSYGIQPPRTKTVASEWEAVHEQLNRDLPVEHRSFLSSLSLYVTIGDYAFVHAGMRPGMALDQQTERDLLWIRDDFLADEGMFDHVIVHGHTPISEPHHDFRRIGVDTGAYLTGKLTAVRLVGSSVAFLST